MVAALALADRLDEDAVLAMHAALLADVQPEIAGRWREEQVWIGGDSFGPHGAAFIPPHHDHVPALMADLVKFTRRADLPLLSQAAIAHAQFETIHPFPDGNGRTGRALIHAMLRGHGLTRNVTVPVSAGLLTDTNGYFDALTAYRDGRPCPDRREAGQRVVRRGGQRSPAGARPQSRSGKVGKTRSRPGEERQPGSWPTSCFASRSSTRRLWRASSASPLRTHCAPSRHSRRRTSWRSSPASPATGCGSPERSSTRLTSSQHEPVVEDEWALGRRRTTSWPVVRPTSVATQSAAGSFWITRCKTSV